MDLFLFYKICKYTQPENTKYCRAFSSGAVTACFYDLGLARLGFKHPTFRLRDQRSTHCSIAAVCIFLSTIKHQGIKWLVNLLILHCMFIIWLLTFLFLFTSPILFLFTSPILINSDLAIFYIGLKHNYHPHPISTPSFF